MISFHSKKCKWPVTNFLNVFNSPSHFGNTDLWFVMVTLDCQVHLELTKIQTPVRDFLFFKLNHLKCGDTFHLDI